MLRLTAVAAGASLCLGALVAGAAAQEAAPVRRDGRYWVQTHEGAIPGGARLRLSAVGAVHVRGADVREVRYRIETRVRAGDEREARAYFDEARVIASGNGPTVTIGMEEILCRRCGFTATVDVTVPQTTYEVTAATREGPLTVEGIAGRVIADNAGGPTALDRIGGSVRVASAGGGVRFGEIGGAVTCESAGGSITIGKTGGGVVITSSGGSIQAGEIGGEFRAETAGGSIELARAGGQVIAGTSGGSIRIGAAEGSVRAETAGGSIQIAKAPLGVRAETASGQIRLEDVAGRVYAASAMGSIHAAFQPGRSIGDSLLETNSGVIVVWLPDDARVTIDAAVDFAKGPRPIQSEFDGIRVRRTGGDIGRGGAQADGSLNGGGALLRVHNTGGRIEIRRLTGEEQ